MAVRSEDSRYFTQEKGKYWEVLYPGEFSDLHPLQGEPEILPTWKKAGSNSLPILSLSHGTHDKEAGLIRQNEVLAFKPSQRVGKALGRYDGTPVGETFKKGDDGNYQQIPFGHPVFSGYLSWWGISSKESYQSFEGHKFRVALDEAKKNAFYLEEADYLKTLPSCRYGNNAFVFSFQNLMSGYKDSRKDCKIKDIYLKKAGTLRYKHEICYVIMVLMAEDLKNDIQALPSMFDEPSFEPNGCIDKDGKLISDQPPSFKVKHPFNSSRDWESMAFAFYFSSGEDKLSLQKELGREDKVEHTFCTGKQPPRNTTTSTKWVCPNDL